MLTVTKLIALTGLQQQLWMLALLAPRKTLDE